MLEMNGINHETIRKILIEDLGKYILLFDAWQMIRNNVEWYHVKIVLKEQMRIIIFWKIL